METRPFDGDTPDLTEQERERIGVWLRNRGVYSFGLLCDIADCVERIIAARSAATPDTWDYDAHPDTAALVEGGWADTEDAPNLPLADNRPWAALVINEMNRLYRYIDDPVSRLQTAIRHADYVSARSAATAEWLCANYLAPTTCLTAPSSQASRCDWCSTQAAAATPETAAHPAQSYLNRLKTQDPDPVLSQRIIREEAKYLRNPGTRSDQPQPGEAQATLDAADHLRSLRHRPADQEQR